MSSVLSSEALRLRDIFGTGADLRVPPYQRGYAWEDAQTSALMRDLIEAFELRSVYFLGAFVLIQTRERGPCDVVDGQQRLTSLTILLCLLRDLTRIPVEADGLHGFVGEDPRMWGDRQKWRLSLNHLDMEFFRRRIQARGASADFDACLREATSESQLRLARSSRLIHEELLEMSAEERSAFARWLLDKVQLVRVNVSDYSLGYRVFLVLNQRGLPLSDHDILKSVLFERAGFDDSEAIAKSTQWNSHAQRLGSDGFEAMLKQVRFIYDRGLRGDFIDALLSAVLKRMTIREFLERSLPLFVDGYEAIVLGRTETLPLSVSARASLRHLRAVHHESWRAPALKFVAEGRADEFPMDEFFAKLERLAYMLQYAVKDRDFRHRRYRRVIESMEDGQLSGPASPLELSDDERLRFAERLRGRFPNFKQRRALLLRANAEAPGGRIIDPEEDATLEHILPRAPARGSSWFQDWSSASDIEELTESLGNFTLLPDDINQRADRAEFRDKLALYFSGPGGSPHFAISEPLRSLERWTPSEARRRRDDVVELLCRAWSLGPPPRD